MLNEYLIELQVEGLSLAPFDFNKREDFVYYKKLPGSNDIYMTHYSKKNDKGTYYILMYKGNKVGMVGIVEPENSPRQYLEIVIDPEYRRMGMFMKAVRLVTRTHKIKRLYSIVLKKNKVSYKTHMAYGFKELSEKETKQIDKEDKNPTVPHYVLYKDF
jgi:RimJ/RimL family protein N-acetyltransferase